MSSALRRSTTLILLSFLLLMISNDHVSSLPLSTHGRWVIDSSTGQRVKLRCVNWVGHMPAVLPEGLNRKPVHSIATDILLLGFNCVRLTWATYLWTNNDKYEKLTVAQSLHSLGLNNSLTGVAEHNPSMLQLTVREAYVKVVQALGDAGVMVVLDNHVSRPQWCCGRSDGNGFFGDLYFDTEEWLRGLQMVASRFRGCHQVVGMSMRNELRGPNQTQPAWYRNIARGARTIHRANPDVLVIVSGMSFDTDLSFLAQAPLRDNYNDKLVLEAHWYAFSDGRREDWADNSLAQVCTAGARKFDERAGFFTRRANNTVPLFVSEFGADQRGTNRADNSFISCFMAFAAERDLDWALWALQGSYYKRNGVQGFQETYGVLDPAWARPKNPRFREKFRLIQDMIQDPRSSAPMYQLVYHPSTGQCLTIGDRKNVVLGDCQERARWRYKEGSGGALGSVLALVGSENSEMCLRLVGDGQAVKLADKCVDDVKSLWRVGSSSGFGLIGRDARGRDLCMERGSAGNSTTSVILTRECVCVYDQAAAAAAACSEDPRPQWFKIVSSNVP